MKPELLNVISVVSNPIRFNSRYKLYKEFAAYVKGSGANLITVEAAFGKRPFEITEKDNPNHIQVRGGHELWLKENLINIGFSRLHESWKYAAWVDADVRFAREDWAEETVHQLQHFPLVQMFSHAVDLGPNFEPIQHHTGFAYCYANELKMTSKRYGGLHHPGFAWAIRKHAYNTLGGLIDTAVCGSGDMHMACAFVGEWEKYVNVGCTDEYKNIIKVWQERAVKHLRMNLGYVPGLLNHHWHGKKADRRYADRAQILVRNKFNPHTDLVKDYQGMYQLNPERIRLRDDLRRYFRSRNEDSIDL